jgi:hypothetical protein
VFLTTGRGRSGGFGILGGHLYRKGKVESAPLADLGIDPYTPAVQFNRFLDDRKSDAGACVLFCRRQRLEYSEDLLEVLPLNPGTVVGDAENPVAILLVTGNFDFAIAACAVPYGVMNQISEDIGYLLFITDQDGQFTRYVYTDMLGRLYTCNNL